MKRYTCWGPVRLGCGVEHRSLRTAAACCDRDGRLAATNGRGCYSDRSIHSTTCPQPGCYDRRRCADCLTDEDLRELDRLSRGDA